MRAFILAFLFLALPVNATTLVTASNTGWVQVDAAAVNFSMQSKCDYSILIKPSAADPGAADVGADAFRVAPRAIWNQNIPTADTWWARAQNGTCTFVVETY